MRPRAALAMTRTRHAQQATCTKQGQHRAYSDCADKQSIEVESTYIVLARRGVIDHTERCYVCIRMTVWLGGVRDGRDGRDGRDDRDGRDGRDGLNRRGACNDWRPR